MSRRERRRCRSCDADIDRATAHCPGRLCPWCLVCYDGKREECGLR